MSALPANASGAAQSQSPRIYRRGAQIDVHRDGRRVSAATHKDRQKLLELAVRVEADRFSLAVDFPEQRLKLGVQGIAVATECVRGRLARQNLQPVQNLGYVGDTPIDDLQPADAVVEIAYALAQLAAVGAEPVGNRQAGWIVTGSADAIAGAEALDHGGLEVAVDAKTLLRVEGTHICQNRSAHGEILSRLLSGACRSLFIFETARDAEAAGGAAQ